MDRQASQGWGFFITWMFFLVGGFYIASCGKMDVPDLGLINDNGIYLPPTAALPSGDLMQKTTPSDIPFNDTPIPIFTATPACVDDLAFIEDVSIPDGTLVNPGQALDKSWEVENTGTCNWDSRYRMKLVAGVDLGASPVQALYPARSGTRAILRILFTAPVEPRRYSSAWQALSPNNEPFGDTFFIDIIVQSETPTP